MSDIDLRFTHTEEIVKGIPDRPDNSILLLMSNYPTEEHIELADVYAREVAPTNEMWDEFIQARGKNQRGRGWHRFEGKYMTYLAEEPQVYEYAQHIKARARVRPIYIGAAVKDKRYSPAWVLIRFIRNSVKLPDETGIMDKLDGL